jgi:hypothetical protein
MKLKMIGLAFMATALTLSATSAFAGLGVTNALALNTLATNAISLQTIPAKDGIGEIGRVIAVELPAR